MEKINKKDLVDEVAERAHLTRKDAEKAVDVVFDTIEEALVDGREVNVSNFGVLTPKTRKSRDGTDPKSHNRITIQETKKVTFRMSKSLKDKINQ